MPYLKLHLGGLIERIDLPSGDDSAWLQACYRHLNCSTIEIAHTHFEGVVLVLDEEGKCKSDWENRINTKASKLYAGYPFDCIVGHCIVGRVDDCDIVPLTDAQADFLVRSLTRL